MDKLLDLIQIKQDIPSIHPHELFSFWAICINFCPIMAFWQCLFYIPCIQGLQIQNDAKLYKHITELIVEFLVGFIAQIVGSREKP